MNLALRDVRYNALRFLLTALGIGLLTAASMVMTGIYRGIVQDALLLVDHIGADLWVVQAGTRGPFTDASVIPASLRQRVEGVPGVALARSFQSISRRIRTEAGWRDVSLLGLSFPEDRGAWLPLIAGRQLAAGHHEVIADETTGLAVGDRFALAQETYTVVGTMRGMVESNGDPIIALPIGDLAAVKAHRSSEAVLLARAARANDAGGDNPGNVGAILATLRPDASADAVARLMRGWGDVAVLSNDEQRELVINGRLERLRKQILIFTTLLTIITAVVVSLIIYTMTLEKLHAIAMLKLIGARNRVIVGMIVQQAIVLAVLGMVLGSIVQRLVIPLFPRRIPVLADDVAMMAATVLATCLLGSAIGIWRALRVRAQEVLA